MRPLLTYATRPALVPDAAEREAAVYLTTRLVAACSYMARRGIERLDREPHGSALARALRARADAARALEGGAPT